MVALDPDDSASIPRLVAFIADNQIVDPATNFLLEPPTQLSREWQRKLLHLLEAKFVQYAQTLEGHKGNIKRLLSRLENHLHVSNPEFSVATIGALATGNQLRDRSDIDLLIALPCGMNETNSLSALLTDLGFAYAPEEGDMHAVQQLLTQRSGYTRLCGILGDDSGEVFTDIFLLAEADLRAQRMARSGNARRIVPSVPKVESYIGFESPYDKRSLRKPPDVVPNYYRTSDSSYYIGFIPPLILAADIYHDPFGMVGEVQGQIWEAVTKAHLYHNGGYEKRGEKWQIREDILTQKPGPLSYLWYQNLETYSPTARERVHSLHDSAMKQVKQRSWIDGVVSRSIDSEAYALGRTKLEEIIQRGPQMVISDVDDTLLGHTHDLEKMGRTMYEAHRVGLPVSLITGRGASAQRELSPLLQQIAECTFKPVYLATNNGATTIRFNAGTGSEQILVDNSLLPQDIEWLVEMYNRFKFQHSDKEYGVMARSLALDWSGVIPADMIEIAKANRGMWIEPGKISVLLPPSQNKADVISHLNDLLGNDFYCTTSQHAPLVEISRAGAGGKLNAAKHIAQYASVHHRNIAVFGDSPAGNDREMLEGYPYSFTDVACSDVPANKPPYQLIGSGNFVYRVHKAIGAFTKSR